MNKRDQISAALREFSLQKLGFSGGSGGPSMDSFYISPAQREMARHSARVARSQPTRGRTNPQAVSAFMREGQYRMMSGKWTSKQFTDRLQTSLARKTADVMTVGAGSSSLPKGSGGSGNSGSVVRTLGHASQAGTATNVVDNTTKSPQAKSNFLNPY